MSAKLISRLTQFFRQWGASLVAITTIYRASSDGEVDIMTTLGFQCVDLRCIKSRAGGILCLGPWFHESIALTDPKTGTLWLKTSTKQLRPWAALFLQHPDVRAGEHGRGFLARRPHLHKLGQIHIPCIHHRSTWPLTCLSLQDINNSLYATQGFSSAVHTKCLTCYWLYCYGLTPKIVHFTVNSAARKIRNG